MAIVVGYTVLELRLHDAMSLKDKRQVVKSVIERVKRRYNVSITEVGEHDSPRMALLGVSCVGTGEAGNAVGRWTPWRSLFMSPGRTRR